MREGGMLTHDLLANTIELMGGELRDIYINELPTAWAAALASGLAGSFSASTLVDAEEEPVLSTGCVGADPMIALRSTQTRGRS
jgi:hypothetical protein